MKNFILFMTIVLLSTPLISAIKAEQKSAQIVLFTEAEKADKIEQNSVEKADKTELEIVYLVYTPEEADEVLERLRQPVIPSYIVNPIYSPSYFRRAGRISWGGWQWTWYSERILPGYGLRIPGRHTDAQGYVRDGEGYLCLASDVHRKGTVLETPVGGYGKVYDCGCGNNYTLDVYVGW